MNDPNQEQNKLHYQRMYENYNLKNILYWIHHYDEFLSSATKTETSWYAMYLGNFRDKLKGKKVLEMGCGDCLNAGIMAALGAEVYANDIAIASGKIVEKLNESCKFDNPIVFVEGDFLYNELSSNSFDYVIGKSFLHHLTLSLERAFIKETARLLKLNGEARFFEPAVNNLLLDQIRWIIPIKGRPSQLNKKAFLKWKENDPHPDRDLSSKHFISAGKEQFGKVTIIPVGTIERLSRFMKWGNSREKFRRRALQAEKYLPKYLNLNLTRSQLIIYQHPKPSKGSF